MPPLKTSCADHAGSGVVRFMRWDGTRWQVITDWMAPMPGDRKLVRQKYVESAMQYAKEKGITPRKCSASASAGAISVIEAGQTLHSSVSEEKRPG
jgi:branched-chain amino acid transport system substrate-binding protein